MRHTFLLIFIALMMSWASVSGASPVYLRPDSRFSSGLHPRKWLESHTREVQMQRWFQVSTSDRASGRATGWMAEDHLLTALQLVDTADLIRDTPARMEQKIDAIFGRPILKKGMRVIILELQSSWARVQPLSDPAFGDEPPQSWIPTADLKPVITSADSARAFINKTASVRIEPSAKAREVSRVPAGSFVHVINPTAGNSESQKSEWLEIRTASSFGYIQKKDAWTAKDLGEKGARPLMALAPLRSSPVPYAEQIRALPLSSQLTIQGESTLRWGLVSVKDEGPLWWPMTEDEVDAPATLQAEAKTASKLKILTSELFRRKIFDMAASKAIPSLKFASAEGVYRTLDGEEWTKIPLFRDQNYPIAVTGGGSVFIGPYVSDDHGETFQQWIRWDSLVSVLHNTEHPDGNRLSILEIKPQDSSGRRVLLTLDIGQGLSAKVVTDDQGMSWRAL